MASEQVTGAIAAVVAGDDVICGDMGHRTSKPVRPRAPTTHASRSARSPSSSLGSR
jgi:hypothetical protein